MFESWKIIALQYSISISTTLQLQLFTYLKVNRYLSATLIRFCQQMARCHMPLKQGVPAIPKHSSLSKYCFIFKEKKGDPLINSLVAWRSSFEVMHSVEFWNSWKTIFFIGCHWSPGYCSDVFPGPLAPLHSPWQGWWQHILSHGIDASESKCKQKELSSKQHNTLIKYLHLTKKEMERWKLK